MHFSEDDLRAALQRKEPSSGFADRVMSRVIELKPGELKASGAEATPVSLGPKRRSFLDWFPAPLRWATVGALVTAISAGGLMAYRHQVEEENRKGEMAKQEAILALRFTGAKFKLVLQRSKEMQQRDLKIRRETL